MNKNKKATDLVLKVLNFRSNIVLTNPLFNDKKMTVRTKTVWCLRFHLKESNYSKKPLSRALLADEAEPPHL